MVWFGVAGTKTHGMRVIPLSLMAMGLLKLTPDGRRAMTIPDLEKEHGWYQETLALLLDLAAEGKVHPIVSDRIPLSEAARAHELMEQGRYGGKVVLVTGAYSQWQEQAGEATAAIKMA